MEQNEAKNGRNKTAGKTHRWTIIQLSSNVNFLLTGTVPINKKFMFDDCRTIVLQCERFRTVSVPFRLSSVPFRFHSVLLTNQRDPCEVSVNASFGSEDDLQLLQMVAEGSRYESASFCVAARAYSDPESRLINYARTQQRAKQRELLGLGHI